MCKLQRWSEMWRELVDRKRRSGDEQDAKERERERVEGNQEEVQNGVKGDEVVNE